MCLTKYKRGKRVCNRQSKDKNPTWKQATTGNKLFIIKQLLHLEISMTEGHITKKPISFSKNLISKIEIFRDSF